MITVIDNFLMPNDARLLRRQARGADYAPWGVGGVEHVKRCARVEVPVLRATLEARLGESVAIVHSGFRLDYEGELPHTAVHYDADCGEMAMVLYLNYPEQCRGGTSFWRHRATDAVHLLPYAPEQFMRTQGLDVANWDRHTDVGMRWNRAVLYPTSYFHSRWPLTGFGNCPENGRLICGAFFNFLGG